MPRSWPVSQAADTVRANLAGAPGDLAASGDMTHQLIRAFIDEGPRAGQTVLVDADPDGSPPQEITLTDPSTGPLPIEESPDIGNMPASETTYRLHDHDDTRDLYLYRAVTPSP
jgi:hypothetical protein